MLRNIGDGHEILGMCGGGEDKFGHPSQARGQSNSSSNWPPRPAHSKTDD